MITCPNCGQSVREGQRFCGSCGSDVQASLHAATAPTYTNEEQQSNPYAYNQPSGYGYDSPPSTEPPANTRMIIIAGALILAVCCAFACGLLFGFELIPDILGVAGGGSAPKPTVVPTPSSWIPMIRYLIG